MTDQITQEKIKSVVLDILTEFPHLHGTVMVAQGNEVLYHQGFSYAKAPFLTDKYAQYLIASVTKQFTAAALLKSLYDKYFQQGISAEDTSTLRGLVVQDLHLPLFHFLCLDHPAWKGGVPEWAHHVTLHHLLTHTSGLKNYNEPLVAQPSEKYIYSSNGYFLIGAVIEEITNQMLDVYFKQALFDPAHMKETYFPLKGTPQELSTHPKFQKLTLGFSCDKTGEEDVFTPMSESVYFDKLSTGGSMISTAHDLVKWNHALYHGQVIPPFLVDMMIARHVSKETFPFYDGFTTLGYGYGLDVYEQDHKRFYQHCGGIAGYQSRLSYNPQSTITIVNLSNISEEQASVYSVVNRLRDLL